MRFPRYLLIGVATSLWLAIVAPLAAQSADNGSEFRLRPGDAVRLEIKDEPTLSAELPVGSDGRVLFPLIGFIDVAGRPFDAIVVQVSGAYARELTEPIIRLTPLVRIAVLGEVRLPGLYPMDPSFTVADAVAIAGGLGPSANRKKIAVIRGPEVINARLDPRSPTLAILVRSGDQIVVGRRSWISENAPILIGAAASVVAAAVTSLIVR